MTIIKGRIWKYGDDVNTDVIFPGKYTYTVSDPGEMPQYALEDLDPEFAKSVKPGDVIVAGKNWGCGSSREQAVVCLKESGLGAIIARSFGRIYYRNCINNALPALSNNQLVDVVQNGEEIEIDLDNGAIKVGTGVYEFSPLPKAVMGIFESGGLIEYTRKKLEEENNQD